MWSISYRPGAQPGKSRGDVSSKRPAQSTTANGPPAKKTPLIPAKPRNFLEKWREGRPWQIYGDDEKMHCSYCIEAGTNSEWTSLRGQNAFIDGSLHFKVDNLQDHEMSIGHKNAQALHLAKRQPIETPAAKGLLRLNKRVKAALMTKMRNIHATAKMGRPFRDFLYLCDLDRAKGLDIGFTYCNATCCIALLEAVAYPIRQETVELLENAKFFSITSDGSTDTTGVEQEFIYLRTCRGGVITQRMLCAGQPDSTRAEDIYIFINQSIDINGVQHCMSKLVGFGSDGAANMQGAKSGVGVRLRSDHPEIFLVKYLAHRLESSFKDAMKQCSQFDKLQTLLLGLYYPQKWHQHNEFCVCVCGLWSGILCQSSFTQTYFSS